MITNFLFSNSCCIYKTIYIILLAKCYKIMQCKSFSHFDQVSSLNSLNLITLICHKMKSHWYFKSFFVAHYYYKIIAPFNCYWSLSLDSKVTCHWNLYIMYKSTCSWSLGRSSCCCNCRGHWKSCCCWCKCCYFCCCCRCCCWTLNYIMF